MEQTIFVVEDDENIQDMLLYALRMAGFSARGFTRGAALFDALAEGPPSMILLDIMLPDEDGISILKRLRHAERTAQVPVIMVTAKGADMDRIQGLDLGADDYITKPFQVMEVLSRIRAVLRRYTPQREETTVLCVGNITLHKDKRLVHVHGNHIELTYREFELLHHLMLNRDIVLSRDTLLSQVWGFDYNGESRTVDMHIKALRQKLGEAGAAIQTVRSVGYKIGEPR